MKAFENLSSVIENNVCIGCGVCAAIDPTINIELDELSGIYQPSGPSSKEAAENCPAIHVDYDGLHDYMFPNRAPTEHGVVDSVFLAQSTNEELNLSASSGGLVKELMIHFLETKAVDGIIALKEKRALDYQPELITTKDGVFSLPGSIYHSINYQRTIEILRDFEGKVLIVGIPCQLEGLFSFIKNKEPKLKDKIQFTLGLTCGWNYTHHSIRAIASYKGIDFEAIQHISYRGNGPVGKLSMTTDTKKVEVSRRVDFDYQVAFDRSFNNRRCHVCINHVNFFADLSVADAWLPSTVNTRTGISLAICRTPLATKALLRLEEEGKLKLGTANTSDIEESQKRRNAYGDFAYAYQNYLEEIGEFTPTLVGPNFSVARLSSKDSVQKFHTELLHKIQLQHERRYRKLWYRKATLELPRLVSKYFVWFGVRILKLKSIFGKRKEIDKDIVAGFR